jgi:hypothetical protein
MADDYWKKLTESLGTKKDTGSVEKFGKSVSQPTSVVEKLNKPVFTKKTSPEPVTSKKAETQDTKPKVEDYIKASLTGIDKQIEGTKKRYGNIMDQLGKLKDPPMTSADARRDLEFGIEAAKDDRVAALGWANVAEKLVGAITKYASAKEGLTRGLDMSKAEIERTDWDAKIDQAMKQYENQMIRHGKKMGAEDKAKALIDAKRSELGEKAFDLTDKIAKLVAMREKTALSARERQADRALKAQEKQTRPGMFEKEAEKAAFEWETKGRAKHKGILEAFDKVEDLLLDPETRLGPETSIFGSSPMNALADVIGGMGAAVGSDTLTGWKTSLKKGTDVYNTARSILQEGMKDKLDSQFARREAELVIQNDFDPGLGKDVLLANMKRLRKTTERMGEAREAMSAHIRAGKTMETYKGPTPDSVFRDEYVRDRRKQDNPPETSQNADTLSEEEQAEYERLKAREEAGE